MLKRFFNQKTVVRIGIVLSIVLVFLLVFLLWPRHYWRAPFAKTTQGIYLESLLPKNAAIAISLNPSDAAETRRFDALLKRVFQEKSSAVLPFIAVQFAQKNSISISENDILKIFGGANRFALGLLPNNDFYLAAPSSNPGQTRDIIKKLAAGKNVLLREKPDALLVEINNKIYLGIVKDVVFAANKKNNAEELFSRAGKPWKSLLANPAFENAMKNYSSPLSGYFFADAAAGFANLSNGTAAGAASPRVFSTLTGAVNSSSQGFSFETISAGDKEQMEKSQTAPLFAPHTASLHKKIPAENVLVLFETHHIASLLLNEIKLYQTTSPQDQTTLFDSFNQLTGFDFDEDLAPFLNKDIALLIQDAGDFLPSVSLYIDASGSPQKASAIAQRLNAVAPAWVNLGNMAIKTSPAVFERAANGAKIYLNRIPEEFANIPLFKELAQPLFISYGLTQDNILFISTFPNAAEALGKGKTFEQNAVMSDLPRVYAEFGNMLAVDFEKTGAYLNRVIELARKLNKISENENSGVEALKQYLSPLKSFLQTTRGEGEKISGKAFLKIENR